MKRASVGFRVRFKRAISNKKSAVTPDLFEYFIAMYQFSVLVLATFIVGTLGNVQPDDLPRDLRSCLKSRSLDDPMSTDEEISISCMLEFMWLNKKSCHEGSAQTVDWLSSMVNKSISTFKKKSPFSFSTDDDPRATANGGIPPQLANVIRSTSGTSGPPKRRKEYRMLTDAERAAYHAAINAMKNDQSVFPNKYDALVSYHQSSSFRAAHGGPAFLGWHRYFLVMYEMALQEQNPDVMLAYWDSTLENGLGADALDSVLWTEEFAGNARESVVTGPFANWNFDGSPLSRSAGSMGSLIERGRVNRLIRTRRSHGYFIRVLESLHNGVHGYVGGNMLRISQAPSDPMFYMHHAFIDCVWEFYRRRQIRQGRDPTRYPYVPPNRRPEHSGNSFMSLPPLDGQEMRNRDGYANFWTEDYYRCAPLPWCSNRKPNCGSKWLQCDLLQKRCVPRLASAIEPEVTVEMLLEVAENLAPEPESAEVQPMVARGMFGAPQPQTLELDDREEQIEEDITEFAKEISTEQFFNALKKVSSKQDVRQGVSSKTVKSAGFQLESSVFQSPVPNGGQSIDDFVIPKLEKHCDGYPTQNLFTVDCNQGTKLWDYIPIQVISLRGGNVVYESYPVDSKGNFDESMDIFSTGQKLSFASANVTRRSCGRDKSGLMKAKIVSYGINYDGTYEDYVFLDNRVSVSKAISYIAVKRPAGKSPSKIFVTVFDECGSVCQPMIIKKQRRRGNPIYRQFSGAAVVNTALPMFRSDTYRGAESLVWDFNRVPYQNDNNIPMVFYCNCVHKPW